jgi:HNH endonuclease
MSCIFCRNENNLTREHVFPAALGCKLAVPDAACSNCNNTFGHTFEGQFLRDTAALRNILSIPNRCGEVPTIRVQAEVEGVKRPALRRGDGEVQLQNVVEETRLPDGRIERRGFFVTQHDAERFKKKRIVRGECPVGDCDGRDVVIQHATEVALDFVHSLETRRIAAKIALVAMAWKYGTELALNPMFDRLREFVSGGNGQPPVRLFFSEFFAASQIRTANQLSVVSHLSAGLHKGWAGVTLFGGLFYIVQTTNAFEERESRSFSIYYDVEAGCERSPVVLHSEFDLVGAVLSHRTRFEDIESTAEYWRTLIEPIFTAGGHTMSQLVELGPRPSK